MGDVVGFDRQRVDPLVENFKQSFFEFGQARATVDDLGVSLAQWRTTARAVARDLQRTVKTLVAGGQVHAVLTDWPMDERESAIHRAQLRAAVNAVGAADDLGPGRYMGQDD